MIRAIMFDLDGTLVQTEKMKALSYAIGVQRLCGFAEPDQRAVEAYREIVGASREEAARFITKTLGLEDDLRPFLSDYSASEPWEVLSATRKAIYDDMVSDPQSLRDNRWPGTVELLHMAKETYCRTALATMSHRKEAEHVLRALGLEDSLDLVLTREDVHNAKPAPDIYLLAAGRLQVEPGECLVIEDSPNGVRAGVAAGMSVVAIATPFTMKTLHSEQVLEDIWIAHSQDALLDVVRRRIDHHNRTSH